MILPEMDPQAAEKIKLKSVIKEHLQKVISMRRGNLTVAAKDLGIGRATIYRYIKDYNLERTK